MPTKTSRPPWAIRPKAFDIDALLPVASMTTSGMWPSVRSRRSASRRSEGWTVWATPIVVRQKSSRLLVDVEHDRLRPGQLDEFQRRQADRPGADDEAGLVGPGRAAVDGVAADGQRLDQGELLEGERPRDVELAGGHEEAGPQAAVAVDAERLVLLAAVRLAAAAGVALLAVDVRLDGATVAGLDVARPPGRPRAPRRPARGRGSGDS